MSARDTCLSAWIGGCIVGYLQFDPASAEFRFDYHEDWVRRAGAFPLSPHLSFNLNSATKTTYNEIQFAQSVRRFFENLLPEGQALEDAAATNGLAKSNLFGLIRALGRESAGAIALLPLDQTSAQLAATKRIVTLTELHERITQRPHYPFSVWDGKVRLSIAGYQDKLAVYRDVNELFLVEGSLASTHILKPTPTHDRFPNLVINEYFCMRLAHAMGLAAAPVEILRVPEPILLVERFDRIRRENIIERIHIIDACQALDLASSYKYERHLGSGRDVAHLRDGASLPKIFALATQSSNEALMRMGLLRWVLLQYLIGNNDAHAKNLSFYIEAAGLRLAPAYDLVATNIYPELSPEFAMAIGDEFNFKKVSAFDWASFAEDCHIERRLLAREIRRLCKTTLTVLPKLMTDPAYLADEQQLVARIESYVQEQAQALLAVADELPRIKL